MTGSSPGCGWTHEMYAAWLAEALVGKLQSASATSTTTAEGTRTTDTRLTPPQSRSRQ